MPQISIRTQQQMYLFFLKTSAPRIAAKQKLEKEQAEKKEQEKVECD